MATIVILKNSKKINCIRTKITQFEHQYWLPVFGTWSKDVIIINKKVSYGFCFCTVFHFISAQIVNINSITTNEAIDCLRSEPSDVNSIGGQTPYGKVQCYHTIIKYHKQYRQL